MNRNQSLLDMQNERNKRREEARMVEIAHALGLPEGSWYVSPRKQRDGTIEYHGDWTALGLTWLLNMDDRKVKHIRSKVLKSSMDNKGLAVAWCQLEFFDGSTVEQHGWATYGEVPEKGYGYCDSVAETRAFKRAVVRATGKGIIDHPDMPEERRRGETHVSITRPIQTDEEMLSNDG